jgi:hypothetical protein
MGIIPLSEPPGLLQGAQSSKSHSVKCQIFVTDRRSLTLLTSHMVGTGQLKLEPKPDSVEGGLEMI